MLLSLSFFNSAITSVFLIPFKKQKVADLHRESIGSWNFKDSSTLFRIHDIKENAFRDFTGYGSRKMFIVSKINIVFLIALKRPQIQRLSKLKWGRGLDSGGLTSGWGVKHSQVLSLTPAHYSQELEHVPLEFVLCPVDNCGGSWMV